MTPREVLDRWRADLPYYARRCLSIVTKRGPVVRLRLNGPQQILHAAVEAQLRERGYARTLHLKPRRYGSTTFNMARLFWRMHLSAHPVRAMVMAQDDEIAKICRTMISLMWEQHPQALRQERVRSNDHEQGYRNGSHVRFTTASTGTGKRGGTLTHLVGTEVAYWEKAEMHTAGLMEQVDDGPGTEVMLESTAAGATGAFYERWRSATAGRNEWVPVFVPWGAVEEYRLPPPPGFTLSTERPNDLVPSEADYAEMHGLDDAQMAWRRRKIADKSADGHDGALVVAMEYPATPEEAFLAAELGSYLNPRLVEAARSRHAALDDDLSHHPLIVSVDPAPSHGDSATAVIRRRAHVAYGLERWRGMTPHDQALRLHHLCEREGAALLVIEHTDIGDHLVSHLSRIGIGGGMVQGWFPGGGADDPAKHRNRKAQNYARLAGWLQHPGCVLPDEAHEPGQPTLATELLSVRAKPDERVLTMESKAELIKRLGRSPDGADALAGTFDQPEPDAMMRMVNVRGPYGYGQAGRGMVNARGRYGGSVL